MRVASLGRRFLATLIDSAALFGCLVVLIGIAAATGALQLPDPATTNPFDFEAAQAGLPSWTYFATYTLLFAYYTILEGWTGASLGKLALGMRVRMDDGRPVTLTAVVVRNLIRIPEALFWYIPAGISCLLSSRGKRLGDFAAGTIVVGPGVDPVAYSPASAAWPQPAPQAAAPETAPPLPPAPPTAPVDLGLPHALTQLKATVLAARGAHEAFLRFSAIELARQESAPPGAEPHYAPEYVSAWYSLSDAVHEMNQARAAAAEASSRAGVTLDTAMAAQPDLVYALRQLSPYLEPGADENLHEAYMQVVRAEAAG